jgi:short-subunit dehydrogenase
MYTLSGKYVLITGASSGIGREMARICAEEGAHLLPVSHPAEGEALAAWAAELTAACHVETWALAVDLASEEGPPRLYQYAQSVLPQVNMLVNNAGILSYGAFAEASWEELERVLRVNARAAMALMRLVLPGMIARHEGRILNTGSLGAFQATAMQAAYGASKAFVQSLSEAVALEARGTGVVISTLNPGLTDTPFLKGYARGMRAHRWAVTLSAAEVARAAIEGLKRGQSLIIPGFVNRLSARVL